MSMTVDPLLERGAVAEGEAVAAKEALARRSDKATHQPEHSSALGSRFEPTLPESHFHDARLSALACSLRTADLREGSLELEELGQVTAAWRTRNSQFVRFRMRSGTEVVAKFAGAGNAGVVEPSYSALRSLTLTRTANSLLIPEPLGWTSDPPCVLTRYIPGTDLDGVVARTGATTESRELIRRCGVALATYHGMAMADPDRLAPDQRAALIRKLERHAIRCRRGALWPSFVWSAHDFAINNIRLADDGPLFWLDPPLKRIPTVAEEDIAKFLVVLYRNLVIGRVDGATRRRPCRSVEPLEAAFLDSYAHHAQGPVDAGAVLLFATTTLRMLAKKDVRRGDIQRRALRTVAWVLRNEVALRIPRFRDGIARVGRASNLDQVSQP